jgi:hypothetical protein
LSLNPTGTQLIFGGASGGVIFNPTSTSYVQFDGSNLEVVSPGNTQFRTSSTYLFKNFAGTSEWMRIDATGKVGIGTSSPSFTLDVFKDTGSLASPAARIGNAQGSLGMTAIAYLDGGSNSDDSGGYVAFRSGGASDAVHLGWVRRSSVMGLEVLTTSNTSLMRVGTDGKVGINETSPGAQLQVNASSASTKGLIIKAAASVSANFFEAQDSTGAALTKIGPDGTITLTAVTSVGAANSVVFSHNAAGRMAVADTTSKKGVLSWSSNAFNMGMNVWEDGSSWQTGDNTKYAGIARVFSGTSPADPVFCIGATTSWASTEPTRVLTAYYNGNVDIAPPGGTTAFGGKISTIGRSGPIQSNTDAGTVTFDLNASDRHTLTLGGNRTLAVTNDAVGQQFTVLLKQDGTGSRTVTWWSGIKWPGGVVPTLTTTANKEDVFSFLKTATGVYYGFLAGANY